jgi:DNA-binding Lrp family transcriptional regulator
MPVSAYVFIKCEEGAVLNVAKDISALPEIVSCHIVTGPETVWDAIAFLESDSIDDVDRYVTEKIQPTEGVHSTSTNIVAGE